MSEPAAPWWAEVQHLRPREDRADETPAPHRPSSRRFARGRGGAERPVAAIATLEHEVADPWATEDLVAPWAATFEEPHTTWDEGPEHDAPAPRWGDAPQHEPAVAPTWSDTPTDEPRATLWDDALEEAFASTPSWADEDDARLLPKGANRIENGRRTIEIRGQVDRVHGFTAAPEPKATARSGRRPGRRASARFERRPDRVAMWAFLLGLLLICIAAFSKPGDADASVRVAAAQPPAAQVVTVPAHGALGQR